MGDSDEEVTVGHIYIHIRYADKFWLIQQGVNYAIIRLW